MPAPKTVLITVYVERPQKRRLSFHKPRHSYHGISFPQPINGCKHEGTRTGYSKKAQLLLYTQQKRETSRQQTDGFRPSVVNLVSSNISNQSNITNQPRTPIQVVAVKSKPKHNRNTTPSCLRNWKLRVPGLFGSIFGCKKKRDSHSGSAGKRTKIMVKRIEVQKKCRSIYNTLASLRKKQAAFT